MTRKSIELFGMDDSRAVSPVIGVILMVAITVILAAVIGTFVLGLGENVSTSAPQAQLTLSADAPNADNGTIYVEHKGGDPIPVGDIEITIEDNDGDITSFNPEASKDGELTVGGTGEITLNATASQANLSWGTSTTITTTDDTANLGDAPVSVKVIHKPSDQLIVDRSVRP